MRRYPLSFAPFAPQLCLPLVLSCLSPAFLSSEEGLILPARRIAGEWAERGPSPPCSAWPRRTANSASRRGEEEGQLSERGSLIFNEVEQTFSQ